MIEIKNYKTRKWQDVTIEECREHRDMDGCDQWGIAAVKNTISYGDIYGGGIDVRCEHTDEIVSVWYATNEVVKTKQYLLELGWEIVSDKYDSDIVFRKDFDKAIFYTNNYCTAFLEMQYIDIIPEECYDTDNDINKDLKIEKLVTDKQKLEVLRKCCGTKDIELYLEESKTNNFVIITKNGEPQGGYDEPFIFSNFDDLMCSFSGEHGDMIITEYQYWTDNYIHS